MCSVHGSIVVAVSLLAACAEAPDESTTTLPRVIGNGVLVDKLTGVKPASNKLASDKLAGVRLGDNLFQLNLDSASKLLSTADGIEVLSFIVSCALPADITLEATVDGTTLDFFGEVGLAHDWMARPLGAEGRGWVSACLFARMNDSNEALPISLRSFSAALTTDADERDGWSVEEGAFYGNLFTPGDDPPLWISCRGSGQLSNPDAGGLVGRDCAKPDPARPGFSLCGSIFAGDCGAFSHNRVCEQFSATGTFYRRCHQAPLDERTKNIMLDPVFLQVITTYVTP